MLVYYITVIMCDLRRGVFSSASPLPRFKVNKLAAAGRLQDILTEQSIVGRSALSVNSSVIANS